MPSAVFYAETSDGYLYGKGSTYAAARATADGIGSHTDRLTVGQYWIPADGFVTNESDLNFNTTTLPVGCTVTGWKLDVWGVEKGIGDGNIVLELYKRNWGDTLSTGDWVPGASLQGLFSTVCATYDVKAKGWSATGYNTLVGSSPGAIGTTDKTRFMMAYDRLRTNSAPGATTWYQYVSFQSASNTHPPRLTVTYTLGPPAPGGGGVDYSRKVFWPSALVEEVAGPPYLGFWSCEEGIAADDRGYSHVGITPATGVTFGWWLPVLASGGFAVPAGNVVVPFCYSMPVGDDGLCTVSAGITCDGTGSGTPWSSPTVTQALPHTGGQPAFYGLSIPLGGTPGDIAHLAVNSTVVIVAVTGYTGTGTILYPIPVDLIGTTPASHVGVLNGQAVPAQWVRTPPGIVLDSPHAGSHANPTLVGANPVLKFTANNVYPTDRAIVTLYSDSLRNQAHAPADARQQMDVLIGDVTAQVIGASQKKLELGIAPLHIQSPDIAKNVAPGATKWAASTAYSVGDYVVPSFPWENVYVCVTAGTSGDTEPSWWLDGSTQAEGPDTLTWTDAGPRYIFGTNTEYETVFKDGEGNVIQTIDLEAFLDVNDPLLVNGTLDPPILIPQPDCTSQDDVVLKVNRRVTHTDPNPLYLEIELVYPDGTVKDWDVGYHSEKNVGYLEGV